jgi:uncharacterized protein
MTATIDARPADLAILRAAARAHLPPGVRVLAFGSRATGRAKPWSDLDLCLMGQVGLAHVAALREALVDSDLPFRVDLVVWDDLDEGFRQIVSRDAVDLVGGADA